MNTAYLFRTVVLFLGILLASSEALATKESTDKIRKERANKEYEYCMAVAKNEGIPAMLAYVRSAQVGTPLKGNSEKLAQENCVADGMGLTRYQDLEEIADDDGAKLFLVESPLIRIKDDVPQARHVARPWTRDYLIELSKYFEKMPRTEKSSHSDEQILVASLIRSRADQNTISSVTKAYRYVKGKLKKFTRGKRSFADCSSKAVCSTHLTGAAVDISLLGTNRKKRELLATRLLEDREKGRILVILERAGNHFHIFVIPPQYVSLTETPAI